MKKCKWVIGTTYIYGKCDSDGRNVEFEFYNDADENEVVQYAVEECLIDLTEEVVDYVEKIED